jgi:hypothetical protein
VSVTIAVQLDEVQALSAELAVLAAELGEDAVLCRAAAATLDGALGGTAGERAGAAATGWASLLELLAARTAALAGTLRAAVASYRQADAALSDRLLVRRAGR